MLFLRQIYSLVVAKQFKWRVELQGGDGFVIRKILDAENDISGNFVQLLRNIGQGAFGERFNILCSGRFQRRCRVSSIWVEGCY